MSIWILLYWLMDECMRGWMDGWQRREEEDITFVHRSVKLMQLKMLLTFADKAWSR